MTIAAIAEGVRSGRSSAVAGLRDTLDRISARNPTINAVTRLLEARAFAEAESVDAKVATGMDPGPLAGVPYGVKDLFDVAGLPTTAGAERLENARPAPRDAEAIRRLQAAGAVLVATLNMDEFAYGFVTDNTHWGITRNPHETSRFAGGSSGGSAAAVAAGMLPFALGSDTNGSIRIPASLCGVYGIKPTHGSLPMAGAYPFVDTLDDIGAFTQSATDLMLVDAVLRGVKPQGGIPGVRVAMLGGWFSRNLAPEMSTALSRLSDALGSPPVMDLPDVARARSAAFLLTAYEGGRLHLDALAEDPLAYDPATRDRLIVGAALPDALYDEAMRFRDVFAAHVEEAFSGCDVLIAPAVYGPAPRIDDPVIPIDGTMQSARANLGLYTQPISYVGLPVVAAPLVSDGLPLGVQLIARKGQDAALLAFAASLEGCGLTAGRIVNEAS